MNSPKVVLVADDYDDSAKLLCLLIELETSWRALPAKNGQEALDISRQCRLHVAILDIDMPVVDGMTAARVMRQRLGKDAPILVALTGRLETADVKRSGLFDLVVQKPIETAELVGLLDMA